jgi:hypothetical protein
MIGVVATAVLGLALAGWDSVAADAEGSGSAPACLPASTDHSAKLAGLTVDVSPAPGTDTADPHTQISFLGTPLGQIHDLSVVGQSSGAHSGHLESYSQGDGASFVPNAEFTAGEHVSVSAVIGAAKGGKRVSFGFDIDSPYSTAAIGGFSNPTTPPSDYQTFYTLPGTQAPVMTVTASDRDPGAGDVFTTNGAGGAGRFGELIYTPQGRLVWFHQISGGTSANDLSVQTYDGQRDLTFWQGKVLSLGYGDGEDFVLNSHYQTVATVKAGNGLQADLHEFQIAPHNVAYITAYNPIRCNLSSQHGPRDGAILDATIEEIDMKTGLVRWEWHALDHVAVSESETSPPSDRAWDWFHINSIDPESGGDVFISARNTWAGYQLQGGSGTILWRLGGLKSSFKMGPGTTTAWQHDGRILANGDVTFFDDGSTPPRHAQSRAITVALDFKTHAAHLVSAYVHANPPLLVASQGNMQTLPNGNTLVGFGAEPVISEYAKNGSLLFDAHLPYEMVFYRAYRFPWSGRPLTPPAATASQNNVRETIVHMSWNGATGVAAWRVLAGKSAGSITAQTTVPLDGFETSTILPKDFSVKPAGPYGYVAVEALDSAGHVLGTSHTVAVKSYRAEYPVSGESG